MLPVSRRAASLAASLAASAARSAPAVSPAVSSAALPHMHPSRPSLAGSSRNSHSGYNRSSAGGAFYTFSFDKAFAAGSLSMLAGFAFAGYIFNSLTIVRCLSACPPVYPPACPPVRLSIRLPVCLVRGRAFPCCIEAP
ncbi:hypothetical protein BC831DRAFT_478974 [Entophlyctis helioformis]|nr:hypothetical protein BC831DRAFT_478974 [Entophlyctis helioformis]